MSKCVITEQDHLEFINGVLHVNGHPHPSLQGCTFKGNVKFAIPIKEVAPSAPSAPPAPPAPVEAQPVHQVIQVSDAQPRATKPRPETVETVGGLDEIKELMDIGKEIMDLPPWMGAVILLGFLYMKMKGGNNNQGAEKKDKQPSTCKGHSAMEARLLQLENANLNTRVQRLEDDITKSLLDSVKELRTPAPRKTAPPAEEEEQEP